MKPLRTWLAILASALATACSCGSGGGSGSVTGVVTDSTTGARLQGVVVESQGRQATTNDRGEFTLDNLPAGEAVLQLSATGYAVGYSNVTAGDAPEGVLVSLKPEGRRQSYDPTQEAVLYETTEAGPYAVFFQPNTLDTSDSNLEVSVTPVDPTIERSVLPGRLLTDDALLLPLTFAEFSIYDSQGRKVNLKSGSEAIVELPIPPVLRDLPQYALTQTIHCYSYNPDTGQWEDFVVGTVTASTVDGVTPVVRASIKHFSWYGAAPETNDCVDVYVKVIDPDGQPMRDVRVEAFPGGTARTDANGDARLVASMQGQSSFIATRTYTDTDGSVSGMPGAKVIDIGRVETELVGLVPRSCRDTGALTVASQALGEQADPLVIRLAPMGPVSYTATGWLTANASNPTLGSVFLSLSELLPGGGTGDVVSGAVVTLTGGGQTVTLPEIAPGIGTYLADGIAYTAGGRYTVSIDVDGNGSVDGSGSVTAVGTVTWQSPTEGATVNSGSFVASWQHGTGSPSGSGILYYVSIAQQDDTAPLPQDFAWYMGTGTQFTPTALDYTQPDLPPRALNPGTYAANLSAFSGPYGSAGANDVTLTPNITGTIVGGEFYSFGTAPAVNFTIAP